MKSVDLAQRTCAAGFECQDQAMTLDLEHAAVLVVADGAGGTAGAKRASKLVVERIEQYARAASEVIDPIPWVRLLAELDAQLSGARSGGETTVVICAIDADGNCGGASVGDSCAWATDASGHRDLTARQKRKPLLGSGRAVAIPFFYRLKAPWTVLVGTDGLFNYAERASIVRSMGDPGELRTLSDTLVEMVRLPSRAFHDDVGFAIARNTSSGGT